MQVVHIVRSAQSPAEGAQALTSAAFSAGSLDNITAVVVALRGYKPPTGPAISTHSPREEGSGAFRWLVHPAELVVRDEN